MYRDRNTEAFLALLRAGLWEQDVRLSALGDIDYKEVYRLAEEQSVVGVVAAGLDHVSDVRIPQQKALEFVGGALQLEQTNKAMNDFIAKIVKEMQHLGIYTLLVKGQGIAQCYERPLWRACGDVDLFMSDDNYYKAKDYLTGLAQRVDDEYVMRKHLEMTIDGWSVELHGTLRGDVLTRMDRGIDEVQKKVFYEGNVRSWANGNTLVFLPAPNEDVILIFTHFLQHFFVEGIGLRHVCDWCRLLWRYREELDLRLLEKRLKSMRLMSEWKAFSALAIDYLGMPVEAMPFYSDKRKWSKKADKVLDFILETGNFGHNRDRSYLSNSSFFVRKAISFCAHIKRMLQRINIFPWDTMVAWGHTMKVKAGVALKGK